MSTDFDYRGAMILGMHDAIVSLTGLIAGLGLAFSDRDVIILSCIISSITASLSMGAANYLAVKATNQQHAIYAALYPDDTDYFYFRHDKYGEIYMARTQAEHDANGREVLRVNSR